MSTIQLTSTTLFFDIQPAYGVPVVDAMVVTQAWANPQNVLLPTYQMGKHPSVTTLENGQGEVQLWNTGQEGFAYPWWQWLLKLYLNGSWAWINFRLPASIGSEVELAGSASDTPQQIVTAWQEILGPPPGLWP
jgi:hypothetical protein